MMAQPGSCYCARHGNVMPRLAPPPWSLFIHSQYMLHYGAGYTRLHQSDGVFGRETKLSKVDMINCFYFVSFVSSPSCFPFSFFWSLSFSSFYISRTAIRDLHCCNGWLFWFSWRGLMLAACFHDSSIGMVRCVRQWLQGVCMTLPYIFFFLTSRVFAALALAARGYHSAMTRRELVNRFNRWQDASL